MIPLADYPPRHIRSQISPEQWVQLVESWTLLSQWLLSMSDAEFISSMNEANLVPFLDSYVQNSASSSPSAFGSSSETHEKALRHNAFLLLHRVVSKGKNSPPELLAPIFLVHAIHLFGPQNSLVIHFEERLTQKGLQNLKSYIKFKTDLVKSLELNASTASSSDILVKASCLAKTIPLLSKYFLAGTDLVDALRNAYDQQSLAKEVKKQVLLLLHACLSSLLKPEQSLSFLLDLLFDLQRTHLLRDLLRKTFFFDALEKYIEHSAASSERAKALLSSLAPYRRRQDVFASGHTSRKGKDREVAVPEADVTGSDQAQQLSLISQIEDLFPNLGGGFIVKLLREYNDDTEQVVAHLLEDDLPLHLRKSDQSEILDMTSLSLRDQAHGKPIPRQTSPPRHKLPPRKNVFDNDDFDRLAVDPSRVHRGRKDADLTADDLLTDGKTSDQKAAIWSALAAFDSDDDERDDTYDAADVGGSIDNTMDESSARDRAEGILFPAYKNDSALFSRVPEIRRSKARAALREQTNMTDEAIEGWAIMLQRDPKRLRNLEADFEMGSGLQQPSLASSAWRADSEAENSDAGTGATRGRGRGGGRYRGSGRGRGNPGGSTSDPATQAARQRKDVNKGSRANHNRRDQRARKVARAGGLVG